jgi:hypothetical protein
MMPRNVSQTQLALFPYFIVWKVTVMNPSSVIFQYREAFHYFPRLGTTKRTNQYGNGEELLKADIRRAYEGRTDKCKDRSVSFSRLLCSQNPKGTIAGARSFALTPGRNEKGINALPDLESERANFFR